MKNSYIKFRLNPEFKQQLKQYAAENETTLSKLIRTYLESLVN